MNKYKTIFNIVEKLLFVILVIVLIVFANGYTYDPIKKEIVQTGVLKIQDIEDNSNIFFNNQEYKNQSNVSISTLDEGKYNLSIQKNDRKEYKTDVFIRKGEVTFISPILIPQNITTIPITSNVNVSASSNKDIYFVSNDKSNINLNKYTLNNTVFSTNYSKNIINLDSFKIKATDTINIIPTGLNLIPIIINNSNILLTNFDNLSAISLKALLLPEKISKVLALNNKIIVEYPQDVQIIDTSNPANLISQKIYSGDIKDITITNSNLLQIFEVSDTVIQLITFDINNIGNKPTLISLNQESIKLNQKMPNELINLNKSTYIYNDSNLFKINSNNTLESYISNIDYEKSIDYNTLMIVTDKQISIYNKDNIYIYPNTKNLKDIKNIELMNDLFNFFYIDNNNKLHLADVGGQDNTIQDAIDNIVVTQNGNKVFILEITNGELDNLIFGNT